VEDSEGGLGCDEEIDPVPEKLAVNRVSPCPAVSFYISLGTMTIELRHFSK